MSNQADTLSQMIEALTEESSRARRRTHANTAHAALRQMVEATPQVNSDAAERRGYEAGLFAAITLLRKVQEDLAAPMRKASYGEDARNAAGAINALFHYADTVVTEFEKRATRAVREAQKETP